MLTLSSWCKIWGFHVNWMQWSVLGLSAVSYQSLMMETQRTKSWKFILYWCSWSPEETSLHSLVHKTTSYLFQCWNGERTPKGIVLKLRYVGLILIPVPRHARQCNTVAWNPVDSNLIAAGLDKYRADHSVLLWDVLKCPHHGDGRTGVPSVSHQHHASPAFELARPVAELGLSETAHSLAWFNTQSRSLIIGMNNKHLKLVDLRGTFLKLINFNLISFKKISTYEIVIKFNVGMFWYDLSLDWYSQNTVERLSSALKGTTCLLANEIRYFIEDQK